MTHNQFIKLFTDIATNHRDINSFGNGDLWEYMANEEITRDPVVLWIVLNDDSIVGGVESIKYTFVVMDMVNKDNSNLDEVLSDTLRISKDIIAILRQPYYEDYFEIDKNFQLHDFNEKFDSEFAGWQFDIAFKQPFIYDQCQANISSLPTITGINN